MKNNLWIFGDSFSVPFFTTCPTYYEKNKEPKIFVDIVSEKLDLTIENWANGGNDNYTIFHRFINKLEEIDENDVIIFGWTDVLRFRVPTKNGWFLPICPQNLYYSFNEKVRKDSVLYLDNDGLFSYDTLIEIITNRDSDLYIYEINDYIKLINQKLSKNKILHWSWMNYDGKMNLNLPFYELKTINDEHPDISDMHYNQESHKFLAEQMLELL